MPVARVSLAGVSLGEEDLQKLYMWVDEIPLSRPKRNIGRDFADAVLVAEVVAHFFPHLVELHNYSAANSLQQKTYNWNTMQTKVFRKLGFMLLPEDVQSLANASPGAIERLLYHLQFRLAAHKQRILRRQQQGPSTLSVAGDSMASPSGMGTNGIGGRPQQQMLQQPPPQAMPQQPAPMMQPPPQPAAAANGRAARRALQQEVDNDLLVEKEKRVQELSETVEILELKIAKLEQLLRLKDAKIERLLEAQASRP